MNIRVVNVTTQTPSYSKKTADIIPFVEEWLSDQPERFQRKVVKIFEGAGIDERFSIMHPEEVFTATSFQQKNDIYAREVKTLGSQVLQNALQDVSWEAGTIDFIITVSCTGIMIPSLDAYLINELQLKQDIVRLPVTEMGCVAGISAMIYAMNFLKAHPGKRAAIVAVESPTATLQLNDFSMANMVSAAIFGDGAACVLMSSEEQDKGPKAVASSMYHFYNATQMMGFNLVDTGLQMVLDTEVPQTISDHFPAIVHPFLEENNSSIQRIDHLIFHPGGKKIVQTVEELFGALGKNIEDTKEVLRTYGNMSSATVLFVLKRFLEKEIKTGEQGLMLSFGPGFTAQRILLEW
ncbi:type III polyketide synthase [Gangjinia marincola]|uniref:Type III polyketide synthase n=1 Tax=Gangjinia marincola TaxID=578463 RepID=A0ABN1MFW8_9FLAO